MTDLRTLRLPDGRQLAWAEHGDPAGTPALFLHGTPGGRLSAATQQERWAARGLRVIAPERPGFGASDPLPGRAVDACVPDLLAVLDACEVRTALVVGGSGGGPHALALGALAPERVRAVGCLVGAAPLAEDEVAQQVGANQAVYAALDQPDALRGVVTRLREVLLGDGLLTLMADAPESDRAQWARVAEAMTRALGSALEPGVEGLLDDYTAIFGGRWGFEPEQVGVPVVWAHGTTDKNVPIAAARRYTGRLPDCRLIEWDDVGHAPGPAHVDELLAALLAAAAPAAP